MLSRFGALAKWRFSKILLQNNATALPVCIRNAVSIHSKENNGDKQNFT
jgi:hypothetical protein